MRQEVDGFGASTGIHRAWQGFLSQFLHGFPGRRVVNVMHLKTGFLQLTLHLVHGGIGPPQPVEQNDAFACRNRTCADEQQ